MCEECFYCESEGSYHPLCSGWGCTAKVHGHGPEGKQVWSYCDDCANRRGGLA